MDRQEVLRMGASLMSASSSSSLSSSYSSSYSTSPSSSSSQVSLNDFLTGTSSSSLHQSIQDEFSPSKQIPAPRLPSAPCSLFDLFSHQVMVKPNATAVQFETARHVTYRELKDLALRLADTLDLQQNTIVPICMDISITMVATILAILASGAAYVLLDPDSSPDRNRTIVSDTGADLVVVDKDHALHFAQARVAEAHLSRSSSPFSPRAVKATDPAYLVYTSGTTGTPKGAVISHRAASYGITHNQIQGTERFLLFYKQSFSAAQRTILATLSRGATLCLASRTSLTEKLVDIIQDMQIDILGITPSALATLNPTTLPSCLRQITTVGEPINEKVAEAFMNVVQLRVSYGCSECAQLNLSRQIQDPSTCNLVGVPHDTTSYFVLRPETYDKVDQGETGELCLVGPQLASGYWNLPEATDKVFVESPYGRMYRTGDLASSLEDGTIQITGRLDNQMKIGGQRLEPEEVTASLLDSEGVSNLYALGAVVRAEKALVVAVIPSEGTTWEAVVTHVRDKARQKLPSYMVPSYWLKCETFPWSSNLKIDVKKLRGIVENTDPMAMLGTDRSKQDETTFAPSDPMLLEIRDAWASQLQMKASEIRGSDSFVELGGSSLDAIKTMQRLRDINISVSLRSLVLPTPLATLTYTRSSAEARIPLSRLELLAEEAKTQFIDDAAVVNVLPLTGLQESLVASSLQGEDMYIYHRIFDVRHLDLAKLRLAFKLAFQHSDIFRSTFVHIGTKLLRVVRSDFQLPWIESDTTVEAAKKFNSSTGFPLGEPFVRLHLVSKQILVVAVHHALFDFWTNDFVFEDVARLYRGGDPVERADYGTYIRELQKVDVESRDQFWKEHLSNIQPTIIGHDRTQPSHVQSTKIDFDAKSIQASTGVTTGAVIYAAWALVLAGFTKLQDVVFATALAGRDADVYGIQDLDGPTLEVIPQKVSVDVNMTLRTLVRDTSHNLWQLNKNASVGMRQALKLCGASRITPFDTFVNVLVKGQASKLAEDLFLPYEDEKQTQWETGYATLQVEQEESHLNVQLYAGLEHKRVQYLLEQFENAIRAIAQRPDATVKSENLVGAAETEHLLSLASPGNEVLGLLHEEFEKQVKADPNRAALQWQTSVTYSYGDLNDLANQTAHFLRSQGVGRGDFVPLLLHKSPLMIICILAVLKAGAAYVPMSPENPVERNTYIFKQVEAKFVLTEEALQDYFSNEDVPIVLGDAANLDSYPRQFASGKICSQQPAYIIFTSGSTGTPKGVQISHGAARSFTQSMNTLLSQKDDVSAYRTLQFSNYIFDVSVYDIFTTLSAGSCLCLAPTERLLDNLAEVITTMGVTHAFLTPTVVKLLKPAQVPTLKTMSVGGEPMSAEIIDMWADRVRLINGYGPTEVAVISASREVGAGSLVKNIGQPLGNTSAVIVQPESMHLTPYGAIGELCFTGPQLAQGYYKDPQKTDKAFVEIPGIGRCYRSGDLARWLPDDELECLGRIDNQIKINGFRIELGEIEAALLRTQALVDCTVVNAELNDRMQLVAFVVFEPGEQRGILSVEGLDAKFDQMKAGLGMLTPYMIPRLVLPVASMPRLPSGKTDRKGLTQLALTLTDTEQRTYAYTALGSRRAIAPAALENDSQKLLAELWRQVLGISHEESISLTDDFFDLGGDSIAAINLSSASREKGLTISVGDIMSKPNIKAMAAALKMDTAVATEVVKFQPPSHVNEAFKDADVELIYPCPPGQAEFLECGAQPEQYWTVMATRRLAEGTIVSDWLALAKGLSTHNEILRTTFAKSQGQWYGAVLRPADPIVEVVDVKDAVEKDQVLDQIWHSRFVSGQPFIRYAILRYPDGRLDASVKMDHGLYDGTLLRIFADHFRAIAQNLPVPTSTDFNKFIDNQSASDREAALSFWLKDKHRPTDFKYPIADRPAVDATASHLCRTPLDAVTRQHGFSASALYQAAFTLWLARASNSLDVSYDYLYTGRNVALPDPQSINGTCANFLPFRTQLTQATTARDFVGATQAQFWAATEKGNVGLEDIFAAGATTRQQSGNNALFLFQPFEPAAPGAPVEDAAVGDRKWIVFAQSTVRMVQPYALVFEVIRKANEAHLLRVGFDSKVMTEERAKGTAREIADIVDGIVGGFERPVSEIWG